MSYDPKANIGRFVRVETIRDGRVVALIKNPQTGLVERFSERGLAKWLAVEQDHNARMPPNLKLRSAVQIGELATALSAVQEHKRAHGVPLDAPLASMFALAANDGFFDKIDWAYSVLKEEIERRKRTQLPTGAILQFRQSSEIG